MPSTPSARKKTRELCVQGLYQWQMAGHSIRQVMKEMLAEKNLAKLDEDYFNAVMTDVAAQSEELDSSCEPFLEIPLNQIDPVSLAILRIGSYEMQYRIDVPYKVVINEGVNLSKTFGPTDSKKFVNAVLDQLAQKYRQVEFAQPR